MLNDMTGQLTEEHVRDLRRAAQRPHGRPRHSLRDLFARTQLGQQYNYRTR